MKLKSYTRENAIKGKMSYYGTNGHTRENPNKAKSWVYGTSIHTVAFCTRPNNCEAVKCRKSRVAPSLVCRSNLIWIM